MPHSFSVCGIFYKSASIKVMNWFFIALLVPIVHSFANYTDKLLVSKYFERYKIGTLIIYSGFTALFVRDPNLIQEFFFFAIL